MLCDLIRAVDYYNVLTAAERLDDSTVSRLTAIMPLTIRRQLMKEGGKT